MPFKCKVSFIGEMVLDINEAGKKIINTNEAISEAKFIAADHEIREVYLLTDIDREGSWKVISCEEITEEEFKAVNPLRRYSPLF